MSGLRALIESDLGLIMEQSGDGVTVTITDPTGASATVQGLSFDISQVFDPATGQMISGRSANVAVRISTLTDAGLAMPRGVSNLATSPWLVMVSDVNGNEGTFKVAQSGPDRTIGFVNLTLEAYTE